MLLLSLALVTAVQAAAPDRVAWVGSSGLSAPADLSVSPDGLAVVFADDSNGLIGVLDLRTWTVSTVSLGTASCSGGRGAAAWDDGTHIQIYTGCQEGTVAHATLSNGTLVPANDSVDIGDGPVLGLLQADDILYVLTQGADGTGAPIMHTIDPTTGTVDGEADFPVTLGHNGYVDMEVAGNYVVVLHGGDNLSKVYRPMGASTIETNGLGSLQGADLVVSSSGNEVFAGGGSEVARYALGDNFWYGSLGSGDGLQDVDALGLDEADDLMLVADGGAQVLKLFSWTANTDTVGNVVQDSFDYPTNGATVSEVVSTDTYTIAGTMGGEFWVMTAAPWVDIDESAPQLGGERGQRPTHVHQRRGWPGSARTACRMNTRPHSGDGSGCRSPMCSAPWRQSGWPMPQSRPVPAFWSRLRSATRKKRAAVGSWQRETSCSASPRTAPTNT